MVETRCVGRKTLHLPADWVGDVYGLVGLSQEELEGNPQNFTVAADC